jgi:hypothetical protein
MHGYSEYLTCISSDISIVSTDRKYSDDLHNYIETGTQGSEMLM